MDAQSELFIVVGPNGSGKSSAIYETQIADEIIFVNPDDIAARKELSIFCDESGSQHSYRYVLESSERSADRRITLL